MRITSFDLMRCELKQDQDNRFYFDKDGQRLYVDDDSIIVLSLDGKDIKLSDFINDQEEYTVEVTYRVKVKAPDSVWAGREAVKKIVAGAVKPEATDEKCIRDQRISDLSDQAFKLGAGGRIVVDDFGKNKDLQVIILKHWNYDGTSDLYNRVNITTARKLPDGSYEEVDEVTELYTGDTGLDDELLRIWNGENFNVA